MPNRDLMASSNKCLIVLYICWILFAIFYYPDDILSKEGDNWRVGLFFVAILINIGVEFCTKKIAYCYAAKGNPESGDWVCPSSEGVLWLIFSPGYFFAQAYKGFCKKKLAQRGRFIYICNELNLHFSVFLIFVALFSSRLHFGKDYGCIGWLILYSLFLRFLSRSLEISYAFVRDALEKVRKKSVLDKFVRIKLAIRSYFEVYFLAWLVHFGVLFVCPEDKSDVFWLAMIRSLGGGLNFGLDDKLKAIASESNVSLVEWIIAVTMVCQQFVGMSIIILTLAMYAGRKR